MLLLIMLTHFNGGGIKFQPTPPIPPTPPNKDAGGEGGPKQRTRRHRIEQDDNEAFYIIKAFLECQ